VSEYCERILAAARGQIGRETAVRWALYPVEHEPIRRWCHMVECNQPLYLDPAYAAATRFGRVVCPPLMIPIFATLGLPSRPSSSGPAIDWPPVGPDGRADDLDPPTAGTRSINLGGTLEFRERVFVGDRLGSKVRLVDVYLKRIKIDPEAFWIVTETLYLKQDERVVAVNQNTLIRHRDRDQIAATTPEQLSLLPAQ
jgi:N-terminal half of MaoC dehydratase